MTSTTAENTAGGGLMNPERIVLVVGALVRSGGGWRIEWRGEGIRARSRLFAFREQAQKYLTTVTKGEENVGYGGSGVSGGSTGARMGAREGTGPGGTVRPAEEPDLVMLDPDYA